jgi:hypothetical protein
MEGRYGPKNPDACWECEDNFPELYKCWECEEYFMEIAPVVFVDPVQYICMACWEGMNANRLADLYDDNDDLLLDDVALPEKDDL